jgi:N-acetylglucosamine malate deacetylase 1
MTSMYPNVVLRRFVRRLFKVILKDSVRDSFTSLSLLKLLFLLRSNNSPTELITDFVSPQVLVLAPHMDDEVLGCGGIIRLHALAGASITVVYMTDGRKGNPDLYRQNLPESMIAEKELNLCATRKDEAERAGKIVGITEQIFLDNPDTGLRPLPDVVERVRNILQGRRPLIVYHPSIFDLHADHWATNQVLYGATKELEFGSDWHPIYRGYEVWMPLLANRIADISDVIDVKKHAIAQFESQLCHTDFCRALIGLNAYRSLYHSSGRGYAEAFYESLPYLYRSLFQRLALHGKPRSADNLKD